MPEKMENTRTLTERDVHLLQTGDRLILDLVSGSSKLAENAEYITKFLRNFGLNHGETYTFARKVPAYKEIRIIGWYIHVEEERENPSVPFQYYAVTPDLEARLKERK